METIVLSKHWPTVEVSDIEVFCILPGCVQLVLMLPTAAAHVLFQLSQQGVAALTAEGVRCCKLRGRVARCDAALGIEEHAQGMHAAALCEAEQAACVLIGEPTLGIKPEPSTKLESSIKPESQSTSAAAAGNKRSGDEAGLNKPAPKTLDHRSTEKDEEEEEVTWR